VSVMYEGVSEAILGKRRQIQLVIGVKITRR
jgi:hypothetical protein